MKTALLGMMILAAPACGAAPATDAVIAEIQAALDKGDATQARVLADGALGEAGVEPGERGRLLLYRGLAQELTGAVDPAASDFTAALASGALAPEDRAQALLQRGFLLDGQGRLNPAIADYTAVIGLKAGGLSTALNNRANIYRRQNRLVEARRDYVAALEQGRSQYAYYGLGQIAEAQHDALAARGFYARAVAADPDYALASQRLAALGGPPAGAIAEDHPVVLKAPAIVLHPPGQKIVLHLPGKAAAATHPARPAWSPAAEARATHPGAPVVLRPALDGPRAVSHGTEVHGAEIQLGAWRSEAEAQAGWAKARSRAGGALDGLTPHIVVADLPGRGRYYRLRTTAPTGAAAFCARLAARGLNCFAARD